jgi:4-amino-4-deoxy-L-arabinose transferase-like glycosyltransferase
MNKKSYTWLCVALVLLFSTSSFLWLSRNSRPPGPDAAAEIRASLEFSRPIAHLSFRDFRTVFLGPGVVAYPPLHFILTGIQFAVTRPSIDLAAAANLFWMVIFSWAAYAIGARFFSPATGCLTVALTWSMTIVAGFVQEVSLEIALMAAVTVSVYLLLRSEHFSDWKWTVAFGVAAGAGLLVKESYPIYLFFPVLFIFARKPSRISAATFLWSAVGTAIALAIAAVWYVPHWIDVRTLYAFNRSQAVTEGDPIGWTLATALYYPNALVNYYLHPLLVLLLPVAFIQNWKRASVAQQTMLVWLAGSYFVLSFLVDNKDVRHFVPCAPAIALLVSDWMLRRSVVVRRTLVSLVLAVSTVFFFSSQWLAPFPHSRLSFRSAGYDWNLWDGPLFSETVPHQENWSIPPLIQTIAQDAAQHTLSSSPVRIAVVPFLYRFGNHTLWCYAAFQNFPAEFIAVGNEPTPAVFQSFDYAITKTGDQGAASLATNANALNLFLRSPDSPFELLASFPLFDGTTASVWKRTETRSGGD